MLQTRNRGVLLKAEAAYPAAPHRRLVRASARARPRAARRAAHRLSAQPDVPAQHGAGARRSTGTTARRPLAAYRALVAGARAGVYREPVLAEPGDTSARAARLTALSEADRAIDEARWVIRSPARRRPYRRWPVGAASKRRAPGQHGPARRGRRGVPGRDERRAGGRSTGESGAMPSAGSRGRPTGGSPRPRACRSEGWRALERGAPAEASAALDRACSCAPTTVSTGIAAACWPRAAGSRARAGGLRTRARGATAAPAALRRGHHLELARLAEASRRSTPRAPAYEPRAHARSDAATRDAASQAARRDCADVPIARRPHAARPSRRARAAHVRREDLRHPSLVLTSASDGLRDQVVSGGGAVPPSRQRAGANADALEAALTFPTEPWKEHVAKHYDALVEAASGKNRARPARPSRKTKLFAQVPAWTCCRDAGCPSLSRAPRDYAAFKSNSCGRR